MQELIYPRGLLTAATALLALVLLATELGYRVGRHRPKGENEQASAVRATLNGALLGLLGLLLGFTFSMAVTRFDARRALVLADANAIGTTHLRTRFLPDAERTESDRLLRCAPSRSRSTWHR